MKSRFLYGSGLGTGERRDCLGKGFFPEKKHHHKFVLQLIHNLIIMLSKAAIAPGRKGPRGKCEIWPSIFLSVSSWDAQAPWGPGFGHSCLPL
jgi:hypothetical protein